MHEIISIILRGQLMTLTNYWWLLIWLFAGGSLLSLLPKKQEQLGDRTAPHWGYSAAILMVLPYIIWGGCRDGVGDTGLYRKIFLEMTDSWSQIPGYFINDEKDPGFSALIVILKEILGNHDTLFFTVIAAFQMLCIAFVFRKYSSDYWICIFLFIVSTDYLSWVHNGMRQFIAVTAIFACTGWMLKKKYIPLIITILLISTIHGSALIMLPIVFIIQGKAWNFRTVLMLVLTAVGIAFIDRFTPILNDLLQDTQYDDIMTNGIWAEDDGTNILRVLVYSVPAIMSLFGLRHIRAADDPVINLCVNCSVVTMALYLVASVSSGIYIGRLPMYTTMQGYMVLPWLIDRMFNRESAGIVKVLMVCLYMAFFYYQMHFTWSLL